MNKFDHGAERAMYLRLFYSLAVLASLVAGAVFAPLSRGGAVWAASAPADPIASMYRRGVPEYDLNAARALAPLRAATSAQSSALAALQSASPARPLTARWNDFGGSPDVVYDFASRPYEGTPEQAARAFVADNAALFGVADPASLTLFSSTPALGGNLVRLSQTYNGIPVTGGGIGVVLDGAGRVVMASGPYFRDVAVDTRPAITAAQARAAADADLQRYAANIPAAASNLLAPALASLTEQASAIANIEPQLGVYPTADGFRLVWKVAKFSTNPFGLFLVTVDANSGEIVARKDYVSRQTAGALPLTADVYPKYPAITQQLKDQGIISVCENDTPCGQERVTLRKFDAGNVVTGLNGTLRGTNTIVNNVLATKQPFAQAARGTWHFRVDDPTNLEARTNEQDQFAEPAEHQDEINAFFFTTYLLEYVDNLHIGSDPASFGSQGAFPDDYPNKTTPLPATVHMPDVFSAAGGAIPSPTDPEFAQKVLGLDNAFALNLTSIIEGVTGAKSPVVVNPTSYGHGFLFNDLALEGTVPYHEGMHAITSPIAGLEGTEGGALNEGQADMWAFTITDNASLGDYVVNAYRLRQRYRDLARDPDSIAYIRSARSTLKYSDVGTRLTAGVADFEEHYDGEIYMSTMWDLREMLNRVYPQTAAVKRPRPRDGEALKSITRGTDIFERIFLGSMYVLGTTSPDTFVKSRDALIVADQLLYSSDTTDPAAPGRHRAMIEQIFAAKELGVNAVEVTGGKATISTQVSPFAAAQAAPAVPQNVKAAPATARSIRVTWDATAGAVAYEVLKRKTAFAGRREPNGRREFADGDASTTGFRHVAFVDAAAAATGYEDRGRVSEVFAPAGLANLFDSEYVVRAIGVAPGGQLGFSNLSGASRPTTVTQDVTAQVDTALANISFAGSTTSFDARLTNARGAFSTDKTIYGPVDFQVVSISNPTVTVRNADAGGNTFRFDQNLALGATSAAKRMEFNNPQLQLFTFDARVLGKAYAGTSVGTGAQAGDGSSDPPAPVVYSLFKETKTGALLAGDPTATGGASATWGNPTFKGVTWDDVMVTTKPDALFLEAALSSVGPDLDFELRTTDGRVLASSATATASEFVSSSVQPNTTYVLRVLGFANGPVTYSIDAVQLLPDGSPNANGGTRATSSGGSLAGTSALTSQVRGLFRFTVNPLLKKVTFVRLQ